MKSAFQDHVQDQYRGVALKSVALSASIFAAALFGFGRVLDDAQAQTLAALSTEIALQMPNAEVQMTSVARTEVETALRAMSDSDLSLTYARIYATFRDYVGHDDLSVARALVDYAVLAQAEMEARGIRRPSGTPTAREMLTTYELVM
ncbi:hypothetical protein [Pararhodobacter marinus]|uniref:Uncharacterized protein n=1 Tax=Pararhodobacter marinus TaxID=2184063 RepID=A0A2U2C7W5_9RHOB|nr:hypothetical protein [Pararhodobacter marinus]PWE27988.1 hypothetical protein C4N9_14145 [Pararhodobacter marinus]